MLCLCETMLNSHIINTLNPGIWGTMAVVWRKVFTLSLYMLWMFEGEKNPGKMKLG